ncbi:MAG: hypothetical protein WC683_01945 [bacterium]
MLEHLGELREGAKLLEEIATPEERRLLGFTDAAEVRADRMRAAAQRAIQEDGEIGSIEHVPQVRMQDRRDLRPWQGKQSDAELVFAFDNPLDAQDLYDFVLETGLVVPGEVALVMDDQAHQYSVHFTPLVLVLKPDVIQMAMLAYYDQLEPEDEEAFEALAEDVGVVLDERAKALAKRPAAALAKRKPRKPSPRGSAEPRAERGVDFNPYHDTRGVFTSREGLSDGGSWSDGRQRRLKATKKGAKLHFAGTKRPCGREARGAGKDIRCWDGKQGQGGYLTKTFAKAKSREGTTPMPGRKKHEDVFNHEDWRTIWECQALYGMREGRYPTDDAEALTLAQHQAAADIALDEDKSQKRAKRAFRARVRCMEPDCGHHFQVRIGRDTDMDEDGNPVVRCPACDRMGAVDVLSTQEDAPSDLGSMSDILGEMEEGFGSRSGRGRDPYWITAKYAGKDAQGTPFKKGDRVFYYPHDRSTLAGKAAEQAAREFQAAKDDERAYNMGEAVSGSVQTAPPNITYKQDGDRIEYVVWSLVRGYFGEVPAKGAIYVHTRGRTPDGIDELIARQRSMYGSRDGLMGFRGKETEYPYTRGRYTGDTYAEIKKMGGTTVRVRDGQPVQVGDR